MNILQVVSSSRTSGAEKHLVILSRWLQRMGHNVIAVCPPGGWLPDQLHAAGIPTVEMPMRGILAPKAVFSLRALVRKRHIDIIHTHLTRATYMGYLAGLLAHVPVISTVHIWSRDFAYRYLPSRNHWFVAVSNYARDALIARGLPASRVQTVYNGTDLDEEFELAPVAGELSVSAELGLPPDAQIVGLFGRVDAFKGHGVLVRAAPTIVAKCPRVYFLFVGPAEPRVQQGLWELASAEGVADRVRFTGVRNDVGRLMAAVDVVTAPSLTETFGMVIVEAMALGKAVVATRAGGIPELVLDNETGVLVERTPQALADAVISLLQNPARRTDMGRAGRDRARALFRADVMAHNMEGLYRRVLESCRW